jgi:V/A-type H+-transporting ATPase subunit I
MIVRMTKIEIAGPKELLLETIESARRLGVLHLESDPQSVAGSEKLPLSSLQLPEREMAERLFFEELADSIDALLALLPNVKLRQTYLHPLPVLDIVAAKAQTHLQQCQQLRDQQTGLNDEEKGLDAFRELLQAVEPLLKDMDRHHELLDLFGVSFKTKEAADRLDSLLEELFDGQVIMSTAATPSGDLVGIVAIESGQAVHLHQLLETENVPELSFPEAFRDYSFPDKVHFLQNRLRHISDKRNQIEQELINLAHSWRPIYQCVLTWLNRRLDTLQATAAVFETGMCFIIIGWLPSNQLAPLKVDLEMRFKGSVSVEPITILQSDLERIPVALMNPHYFKPFERLTALLPLPHYSSFDPTPFLGIFFPIFFGMMLGDIGYGLIILVAVSLTLLLCKNSLLLLDGARILGACAVLTILFGFLYGELFGDWGTQAFNLHPILFERSQAIIPMIYFSVSAGAMHILLGMLLGFINACRRRLWKKGALKFIETVTIIGLCLLLVTLLKPETGLDAAPFLLLVAIAVPTMVVLGGLLAPLELLKTIGNIVSYARIMAIGTTSVLLAVIANRLGGMTGDIFAGLLVAGVLHSFNLLLGIFAPTIHSLRLHYVEFFSKFLEVGGRRFAPLDEKKNG